MKMKSITLTKWWEAFKSDLERLEFKFASNSDQWKIAEELIREGSSIESNLTNGLAIRKKMDGLAQQFGHHYQSNHSQQTRYLPEVNNPDDFILVLLYRNHLKRYTAIQEGNFLVLRGINQELPMIQEDIKELEKLLNDYASDEQNGKALYNQFIGLEAEEGSALIEQMENFIAAPSLEETISSILAQEGSLLMQSQNLSQQPQVFFESYKKLLEDKKTVLEEMSYCKELIELLEKNTAVPLEALLKKNKGGSIKRKELWQALMLQLPMSSFGQYTQSAKRATAEVITSPLRLASSITHWVSQKNVLPTMFNKAVSSTASVLDNIDKSLKPLTVDERKRQLLRNVAENHLNKLIDQFSDNPNLSITFNGVMEKPANLLKEIAKKITMEGTLNALQKALENFEQTYEQGIVRISLESIFGVLTQFFTKTFLKPLINDTVLLVQTTKKLQQKLNILQKELGSCHDEEEINLIEAKLSSLLEKTRKRAEKVRDKSLYLFFREEHEKASADLQALMDAVPMRNVCKWF